MNLDVLSLLAHGLARLETAILVYFLLVNSFYGLLLLVAARQLWVYAMRTRSEARWRVLGSEVTPRITILAPAFDEANTIERSLRTLLTLYYPSLEVLVVNDGSHDGTMAVLLARFDLEQFQPLYEPRVTHQPLRAIYRSRSYPNLVVIDKENGGKADALNAGLNAATGELVCAMDADTVVEPDAMQRLVRPFLTSDDLVTAGGTIMVLNGTTMEGGRVVARASRRLLPGIQTAEYLRAFLFGRLGFNQLGGNLIVSGAFGLFRRESMLAVGGYQHDTVGEDMELVLRLRRTGVERGGPSRVEFVPDPVAWTEVPASLRVLGRQRDRWHRGLADVLWPHRRLFFNPRYGLMGMLVFPYFVLVELLAPLVEMLGLLGLAVGLAIGAVDGPFAALFFLVAYGYGLILTVLSLLLEGSAFGRYVRLTDRLLLLGWALVENLGYRQLTVIWRLVGLVKYLRGRRDWGRMEHIGPPGG